MYKKHITGLKGFACLMVMFGHFIGVFAYAEKLPFETNYISAFRDTKLGFVIDESYWLYLFFIISGYLLAFSNINSGKQLLAKSVQRFLRLGLPIFFAYAIIYVVYLCVGFHNAETVAVFENAWFQNAYSGEYSVLTVIRSFFDVLILGNNSLNSPYWVLREMFFASILIYTITLINNKLKDKIGLRFLIAGLVALGAIIISKTAFFCFVGSLLAWCEQDFTVLLKKQWFLFVLIICSLSLTFLGTRYRSILFFTSIIILIPKVKILDNIFSSKFFEFLGKISFGIYSFHWPLYCSVGSLVILGLYKTVGLGVAVIIAMTVTTVLTTVFSWIYNISCEKVSNDIAKKSYSIFT